MSSVTGVLALQGDFALHIKSLEGLGIPSRLVRNSEDLKNCRALILPGGESTTLSKLLIKMDMWRDLKDFARTNPVMGTCAGLILLSAKVINNSMETLSAIDLEVERNAYGRQVNSFIGSVHIPSLPGRDKFEGIFIRAPKIVRLGDDCVPLGFFEDQVVLARNRNVLAAAFHPELTGDRRVHRLFLETFGI